MRHRIERGDTIVEVAVSFAIFMLVTMGAMTIMSQGVAIAQRSLEQTQVRQVMNGQADILRLIRQSSKDSGAAAWTAIKDAAVNASLVVGASDLSACPVNITPAQNMFFVTKDLKMKLLTSTPADTANYRAAQVTSQIDYEQNKVEGVWVQAVKVQTNPGQPAAYDMYIRSCWNTVGTQVPITMATIVRLYDV